MKVEITGWKAKNLRGYLRDVEINLGSPQKRWSLIQMPNGTGKTTTMSLLRVAMSGMELAPDQIKNYKADDLVEEGFFELSLMIDGAPWRVELEFDFRRQTCEFFTTSIGKGSGGRSPGFDLPTELTQLGSLTDLFIFDGELASAIITIGKTQADQAIRGLYRLDHLTELKQQAQHYAKTRQQAATVSKAASKGYLERYEAEYKEALQVLDTLKKKEKSYKFDIEKYDKQIKNIQNKIENDDAADEKFKREKDSIKKVIATQKQRVSDYTLRSIKCFRLPPLFHDTLRKRLNELGGTLQELKLPRTTSREFFKHLAKQEQCICDREIGKIEAQAIRNNAEDYLGEDQIVVINHMKDALAKSEKETERFDEISTLLQNAQSSLKEAIQKENKLDKQKDLEDNNNRAALKVDLQKIQRQSILVEDSLYKLLDSDTGSMGRTWKNNIPLCMEEVDNRENLYNTVLGTFEISQKVLLFCKLIDKVEQASLKSLRSRIRKTTNDYLDKILPNEALRVSSIDGSLRLTTNQITEKIAVSEGQKLAVSYAFLTALLHNAPHELPFIVDSPAVSLDTELRRTVSSLIPDLFDQMIMFVISSEREGFAEFFYTSDDVRYATISIDRLTGNTSVKDGIEAFQTFHSIDGEVL
ncbi:MAG: hypothetical protein COB36_14225 [Alphaproteobacteria bacterium]|nr:MAG: hypothetical protein COB36_14225 [Alphaproteobacteria bacterium]